MPKGALKVNKKLVIISTLAETVLAVAPTIRSLTGITIKGFCSTSSYLFKKKKNKLFIRLYGIKSFLYFLLLSSFHIHMLPSLHFSVLSGPVN